MKVNFKSIENIEDLRSIPPGEYTCKVAEVRESESPAGHTRWGLRWEVVNGEYVGKTACWDSLHWSERGMPRAKYILEVLGVKAKETEEMEVLPETLVGMKALVECKSEEREDPITGIRRWCNRVPFAGYQAIDLKEMEIA